MNTKMVISYEEATKMDREDPLNNFRQRFNFPQDKEGKSYLYFCGNSLGLQPKSVVQAVGLELDDWAKYGVEGHLHATNPWLPYHEHLTEGMAHVVGALPTEVVVMNTLTVNLHLMMVSFYRPTPSRHKIMIEADAFPSDRYAVASQAAYHGYKAAEAIIALRPRTGEYCLREEDILQQIEDHKDELALIMLGNTNYYTGQAFDMKSITDLAHRHGITVGFDCAHGAGNLDLKLHESGVDFAVWCTYKYLNSGPGSVGACFVHERHHAKQDLPRFNGWWGHNKATRFGMRDAFDPIPTVEAWQLSNPPILSLAAIKASLQIFQEAGIEHLRAKSIKLTSYLETSLLALHNPDIEVITPLHPEQRGSQLSVRIKNADSTLHKVLFEQGVITDWREPDVIRIAPAPLYNSFTDIFKLYTLLNNLLI